MYLSIQGEIKKTTEFYIDPLSDGLQYGAGVFETLKYDGATIYFLFQHLQRLRDAADKLGLHLSYTDVQITAFLKEMIDFYAMDRGVLKINLIRDLSKDILMIFRRDNNYTPEVYQRGLRLKISAYRRNERSFLIGLKTDNYLENILALRTAKKEGYDEVLFLNSQDALAEGSLSNVFFVKDGVIYTPALECGILPGIMRECVLDLAQQLQLPKKQGVFGREELLGAEEVFITNSVMEIMPVMQIEQSGKWRVPGRITKQLMQEFTKKYRPEVLA